MMSLQSGAFLEDLENIFGHPFVLKSQVHKPAWRLGVHVDRVCKQIGIVARSQPACLSFYYGSEMEIESFP